MKKILIAMLCSVALPGCMGYVPGQQSYWDTQVREMCGKDGGVSIVARLRVSKQRYDALKIYRPHFSIPPKTLASDKDLLYADEVLTILRDANPRVLRSERIIKSFFDDKVIARAVSYSRVGGDIPSLAHPSHYRCPEEKEIFIKLESALIIREDVK